MLATVVFLWLKVNSNAVALYMSDQLIAGDTFRYYMASSWAWCAGFPQWMPHQFGGMPFVEAFHGSLFYPPANAGIFPAISVFAAFMTLLILTLVVWWWSYNINADNWVINYLHLFAVCVYGVFAVVLPFILAPLHNVVELWAWGIGAVVCWLMWICGGRNHPASSWNLNIAVALLLSIFIPITLEMMNEWGWVTRAHGYALDWMADYVKAAPPAEVIMHISSGKPWHYSMWLVKPVMMMGWFSLIIGIPLRASWNAPEITHIKADDATWKRLKNWPRMNTWQRFDVCCDFLNEK